MCGLHKLIFELIEFALLVIFYNTAGPKNSTKLKAIFFFTRTKPVFSYY